MHFHGNKRKTSILLGSVVLRFAEHKKLIIRPMSAIINSDFVDIDYTGSHLVKNVTRMYWCISVH